MKKVATSLLTTIIMLVSMVSGHPAQLSTNVGPAYDLESLYRSTAKADQNFTQLFGALTPLATPYLGVVSTATAMPDTINNSNQQGMSRSNHIAKDTLTQAGIVFPCHYSVASATGDEVAAPGHQWRGSIEYPAGTIDGIVTFGGAGNYTGTCGSGGLPLQSDVVALNGTIPKNARFWVRMFQNDANGILFKINQAGSDYENGALFAYGATTTDYTQVGTLWGSNSGTGNRYVGFDIRPLAVIAPTQQRSFLLLGDSRVAGKTDVYNDGTGDLGYLARSIGQFAPYINLGLPSDRSDWFIANHAARLAMAAYASDAIIEYQVNEAVAGVAATTIQANLATIRGYLPATMPVSLTTAEPFTSQSSQAISALSQVSGNLIQASTAQTGWLRIGEMITIAGASPAAGYNGPCTVQTITINSSFTCLSGSGVPASTPATGTVTFTDSFQSTQLQSAGNTINASMNLWKRGLTLSLAGYSHLLDVASIVENGESFKWYTLPAGGITPGSIAITSDGVHLDSRGTDYVKRSGVINPRALN